MTELRWDQITLPAAGLGGENPLPRFRQTEDHLAVPVKVDLTEEELVGYGRHQAERVLPHRLQDGFDRNRREQSFRCLVLENDFLKAIFMPQWGGRLWSLFDKKDGRELLHRNPVFQPANLALRLAWNSGGIEWNMGRFGHHDYTLSPLFAARVRGIGGAPALRFYEWDRVRCFPWQIDFCLPEKSRFLWARIRLINPHDVVMPNYWWTNIAVEERPDGRVLAPAEQVLGMRPSDLTLMNLPYPRITPDGDELSYPGVCEKGGEYFFKIPKERRKWIAYVEADGRGFVQTSTDRLLGRKCFYWGRGSGGRRWQEFLSVPGRAYIEIQAGLATAQAYSVEMPPRAVWTWTEAFGALTVDARAAHDRDYARAWRAGEAALEQALPRKDVERMDEQMAAVTTAAPDEVLHNGSGWGALERRRIRAAKAEDRIPGELVFPEPTLGEDQAPWLHLLEKGELPTSDPAADPGQSLVQPEWRKLLESAVASGRGQHWRSWYHLGVMRMECRENDGAIVAWSQSLRCSESAWAFRGLAVVAERGGRTMEAAQWLEKAWKANPAPVAFPIAIEYAQVLNRAGRYADALEFCESLPAAARALDRLRMEEVRARIFTHRFEGVDAFFQKDFALLREWEQSLRELWFQYQELRLSVTERIPRDRALRERVQREFPPPHAIDFS
jgi:tetratricopeptide (TPR) repeat protein